MYIQAQTDKELQLPQNYSGSAFPKENLEPPPPVEEIEGDQVTAPPPDDGPAVEAGAFFGGAERERCEKNERGRGLFSGISPLLSSFLPPRCEKRADHGQWRDLVLIGVAVLLFLREDTDDLLPLLLLLLLWD